MASPGNSRARPLTRAQRRALARIDLHGPCEPWALGVRVDVLWRLVARGLAHGVVGGRYSLTRAGRATLTHSPLRVPADVLYCTYKGNTDHGDHATMNPTITITRTAAPADRNAYELRVNGESAGEWTEKRAYEYGIVHVVTAEDVENGLESKAAGEVMLIAMSGSAQAAKKAAGNARSRQGLRPQIITVEAR